MAVSTLTESTATSEGHRLWVRVCHWVLALSVCTLAYSGAVILLAHPRLYWGQVGNDLTPALLELPLNDNHRPDGWVNRISFGDLPGAPVSADRGYEIFNQNGWARSLHFLAGWFFVIAGAAYVLGGIVTGHIRRHLSLRASANAPAAAVGGPPYGTLQRRTYVLVAFVVLPFMVLAGLAMAPAVTAAYPMLLNLFGGQQTARTLHFAGFAVLVLFVVGHVAMVVRTGFGRQMRAMIVGR